MSLIKKTINRLTVSYFMKKGGAEILTQKFQLGFYQGWYLFLNDYEYRYQLNFFGYWWVLLKPVATILPVIFAGHHFGFSNNMSLDKYLIYAVSGVIFWNAFWDSIITPMSLMRRTRKVFKTVVLLPSSLPWACFFVALINFSFSIIVLVSIYFYFDFSIGLSFLSVFIAFLICFAAGLSFGLPLASFSNIYQDFSNSVGFLGSVLLWFTPVFYQTSNDGTLGLINFYNPINYLISAPRAILLNESYPHWVIYSTCICVFGMNHLIGFWFYKNTVRKTLEYVV